MAFRKVAIKVRLSAFAAVLFVQMRAACVALGSDTEWLIEQKKMVITKTTEKDMEQEIVLSLRD